MKKIDSFNIIDKMNVGNTDTYKMSFNINGKHIVTKSDINIDQYQLLNDSLEPVSNIKIDRKIPYLYNRLAIGYINVLDETIIPKKHHLYDEKNNRIFTNSLNKCYYRNGNKINCRIQECKDGIHVIVEAEKSYGAALLMVKKADINFHKFLLNIDFKTAVRIYHTANNIAKVMELI